MESATTSLRQQGIQALRAGQLDAAINLLSRAVAADGQDAEAQEFLGVAQSQKGLHAQAKRALQTAADLQPRNPHVHYNLGAVLERAGDTAGALRAYQETLQIEPEHEQARKCAAALAAGAPAAAAGRPEVAAPPSPAAPRPEAPWLVGQSAPAAQAPVGPHGTVHCAHCQQWSRPGLDCEWCGASLKSPPAPMAGAPLAATGGPSGCREAGGFPRTNVPDRQSLGQVFRDWVQVLLSPGRFFREQRGRVDKKALVFQWVSTLLLIFLPMIPRVILLRPVHPADALMDFIGKSLFLGYNVLWNIYMCMVMAYAFGKQLGGPASGSRAVRAVIYALAPMPLFAFVSSLMVAMAATASREVAGSLINVAVLVALAGLLVYMLFLGIGIFHVNRLSSGAAAGVAIVCVVLPVVTSPVILSADIWYHVFHALGLW